MLDDQRAIIGMTLGKNEYSTNDTNLEHLNQAKNDLIVLQPNIKAYQSDSPKILLINGEASIGYVWGTEAYLSKLEYPYLKVVVAKVGLFLEQDNFVIPKGTKEKQAAEQFIDFILNPKISAEILESFPYANPNEEAHKLMKKSILDDTAVYPPSEVVRNGEHLKDIGDNTKYFDKIWSLIKQ